MSTPTISAEDIVTPGDISKLLGVERHRVAYVLEAYHIEPVVRKGNVRLYLRDQIPQVQAALTKTESRRAGMCR